MAGAYCSLYLPRRRPTPECHFQSSRVLEVLDFVYGSGLHIHSKDMVGFGDHFGGVGEQAAQGQGTTGCVPPCAVQSSS